MTDGVRFRAMVRVRARYFVVSGKVRVRASVRVRVRVRVRRSLRV